MKALTLLGQTFAMSEVRGTVLDTTTSHTTQVSGGGGSYRGTGMMSINSSTSSETKIYLDVGGREQAVVVPGDYELRKGHDVTVVVGSGKNGPAPLAVINHSLDRVQWRAGDLVATALGVPPDYGRKWAAAGRMLIYFFIGIFFGSVLGGPGMVLGICVGALVFWSGVWRRRKKAQLAVDAYFRSP